MSDVTAAALIGALSAFTATLVGAILAAVKAWLEYRKAVDVAKLNGEIAQADRKTVADKVEQVRLANVKVALHVAEVADKVTETHDAVNGGYLALKNEVRDLKAKLAAKTPAEPAP